VAIRDVRQGEANQVGGQQMLDLLQLVKDAEWSRDRLGRHRAERRSMGINEER
jgi:hypothetical protein